MQTNKQKKKRQQQQQNNNEKQLKAIHFNRDRIENTFKTLRPYV